MMIAPEMIRTSAVPAPAALLLALLLALSTAACAAPAAKGGARGGEPRAEDLAEPASQSTLPHAPGAAKTQSRLGSFLAGRHAQSSGDTTFAADYYLKALAADPDNAALRKRAMGLCVAAGRYDEAFKLAETTIRSEPKQELARTLLALRAVSASDFAGAAAQLGKGEAGDNGWLIAPLMGAWVEVGRGNVDAGLKKLEKINKGGALSPFVLYHQALINDFAGRTAAAEAAYAKLTERTLERSARLTEARVRFLARTGKTKEANAAVDAYLIGNPDSPAINRLKTEIAGGAKIEPMATSAQAGISEMLLVTASTLNREQAGEAVEIYLRLALYLRPNLDIAWLALADHFESEERFQEAIEAYQKVDRRSPLGLEARIRSARALDDLGKTDEALSALNEIAAQDPAKPDARIAHADLLRSKERFDEAAASYSQAIAALARTEPRHWGLFFARGIAYERAKQWPKAEADLLKALELNPNQPSVLNYLGYSWIDQGIKFDEGRRMIERAVQLRPNDGYFVDSLGWAFYRMGDFQAAVEQLERAVELKSDDPIINDHLGDAYWQVGRRNEAKFQWQRALSFKPEADAIPVIERKLERGLEAPDKFGAAPDAAPSGIRR